MMKILRGIDSALLKIQNLILVFSTAIIILFMCTGVVMRYFFHANFHGLEELLLILGFWIYFFGGSVAFHDEDHMEASILQPRLKTQKSKDIYLIARNVLSLPTLVIVCKWSYDYVVWSIDLLPTTVGSSPQMARSKMRKATLMGLFFCVSLGYALTGRLTGTAGRR